MRAFSKNLLLKTFGATPRPLTQRRDFAAPLTILVMTAFAAIVGLGIPILEFWVPAIVSALVLSVLVLALPPPIIIWLMLILVFLVVGQLTFFLGFQQALWLPYLLLLLIAVKYLMERFRLSNHHRTLLNLSTIPILIGLSCSFFFLSAVANRTDFASVGVAAKNYIFPWFLTLFMVSAIKRSGDLKGVWNFILWIVFIQVPFAALQHFYFAKLAGADWDAVVGTFGGGFLRGGGSGTMAIFLVFGIVLAASLYRRRLSDWRMLLAVTLAALATVALAEVKIFFICLPIALVLLFRRDILSYPIIATGFCFCGALLLGAVLLIYQQSYSERLRGVDNVEGFIDYVFAAESDPYFFNRTTKEVSRVGALLMWERYNQASDYRFYIGHGPAASRQSQTIGTGVAARKYPFTLETSTASTMLWDVGLLGYGLFLTLLLVGGMYGLSLARGMPPQEAAALDTIGVMLLLDLPLSMYNRDLIDSSTAQILLAFSLGYVLLCRKMSRGDDWRENLQNNQRPKNLP